jgi:hypothetical protein
MTTSLVDAQSVITIDLGSVNTRAHLFDVVDGKYHFIAGGSVPTTANAPFRDIGESIDQAIKQLQDITGRVFQDKDEYLIIPSESDGSGVDQMIITYSAGPTIKAATIGLLGDVSLESARHLMESSYFEIVESISLSDARQTGEKIDALVQANPDLVLLVGGIDQGANRSVLKMAELVLMVCRILPEGERPKILYAGNQALGKKIKDVLAQYTTVAIAPNLRPTFDQEDISPAQAVLAEMTTEIRGQQIGGINDIAQITGTLPQPSAYGFGRIIRFLSRVYDPGKGVLGIDLGANYTTAAAAWKGESVVRVSRIGVGEGTLSFLSETYLTEITNWIPFEISKSSLQEYLWEKYYHPTAYPLSKEALAIEHAIARIAIQETMRQLETPGNKPDLAYEPVLASGATLTQAPNLAQTMLMLLDGIQPSGITTFILDQNQILSSLGAAAEHNSVLPVQVLESGAFMNLGTAICPVSPSRNGTLIMRIKIEYDKGGEERVEIRQGSLTILPLKPGQSARIHITTHNRTSLGQDGRRGSHSFRLVSGQLGVIVDARGRPLKLPGDSQKRIDLLQKWSDSLKQR